MMPSELLADLDTGPIPNSESLLFARILLRYLADHARDAQLADGSYLSDITSFVDWLRELAEAARTSSGRKVPSIRPAQACYDTVRGDWCPDCGHVHVDESECQFPIGGGRRCRCERQVPA